jgi:alanyl-tRNA synthetase
MATMDAKEIRRKFLEFFRSKSHDIVPSAPLVIKNDPTLMFTNAGMNQFKDYFLGTKKPVNSRVADTQKCLRVSGKHNDLEEVGIDTYHHTLFEMLGNWSFGNYFKKEAIAWAWELLTEVYALPKDKLYVTVFAGDEAEGLETDQEAADLWKAYVPEDRILYASKKDNFWEMGETGPCGPCSEIHIDLRDEADIQQVPGREMVNQSHPLVIEIWNLVFIQFNRLANGSLEKLPAAHVDTGMGFERLAMAIQGKKSNYDTDVFQPLIGKISKLCGIAYGASEKTDIAMRVVADHCRAISFAVADGQLPSNNKAGYVIRRILRRAVRYGYTFLGIREPFIHELVAVLAWQFEEVFPEIQAQQEFIAKVVREEEASFLRTLDKGLGIIQQWMEQNPQAKAVDGQVAFELYDTYGFPYDLTALIARENGLDVDEPGFQRAMAVQKERSRQAASSQTGDWIIVNPGDHFEFLGYDATEGYARILRYREIVNKKGKAYQLVFDQSPFYAESGGQIGDTGYIEANGQRIAITDTKKENDLFIHFTETIPADVEALFYCKVDDSRRKAIESNHTATHLLHAALRSVLGTHVQQKGSLVSDEMLRFDFSHFAKMTDEELMAVEQIVNEKIRENIALQEMRNLPIQQAKDMGAMALFGEKYGEFVRVIVFDRAYSVELCGGTHVPSTGKIGFCKIVAESSVAAGVRRIEALTGKMAENYMANQLVLMKEVKELLKNPVDLKRSVLDLLESVSQLQKAIEKFQREAVIGMKASLLKQTVSVNGVTLLAARVELPDADAMRTLAFELRAALGDNAFIVLGAVPQGKPQLAVILSDNLVAEKGFHAGKIVKELAREIQGGGGGQPFFATAGGKIAEGLDKAISAARNFIG